MEAAAHIVSRPVALSIGSTRAVAAGQGRTGASLALRLPTPAQLGCPFARKAKWQQAWGDSSLRASLDLTEARRSSTEEGPQKSRRVQRRSAVYGQPTSSDTDNSRSLSVTAYLTDEGKEKSMQYRRTVFGHTDWMRHRSSSRHYRHIITIGGSRVILALAPPVLVLTGVAFAIAAYNESILSGVLPDDLPILKSSALPFQLTAPALALLLVFRTNASYSRFDEARKMWGATLNRVRDFARQALSYMGPTQDCEELLRYLMAFPYTFKAHMLREDLLVQEVQGILTKEEIDILMATDHRPNYTLQVMSEILSKATTLTDFQRIAMDHNLTHFSDQIGGSERIFKTPLPLSYTRLTSRFLVLWHFLLPLALWDACHWMVVPATFMSAAALFCIEEVGVLIEEPFSILALAAICGTAQRNVEELINVHVADNQRRSARKALEGGNSSDGKALNGKGLDREWAQKSGSRQAERVA